MGSKRKRGPKDDSSSHPQQSKKRAGGVESSSSVPSGPITTSPFVEDPAPADRQAEAALYDLLGSEDPADRVKAAHAIITCLLGGGDDRDATPSEAVVLRHLERRLLRGLASGRNASRIGFSLALTEILSQLFGDRHDLAYPGLTFDKVLAMLVEKTTPSGNLSGQEERDHFLGQLFGLESFVMAKILFDNNDDDESRWAAVLGLILGLSGKKAWLRPQCGWLITQALPQMGRKRAKATLKKIAKTDLAMAPEGLAIWVTALDTFPDLTAKPWKDPFGAKRASQLSAVLREQAKDDNREQQRQAATSIAQGQWTSQLHFVWDTILSHFLSSADLDKFAAFWSLVVDEGLFSKTATDGQKFRGFLFFQATVQIFGRAELPDFIFSPNLMACLKNQAAREDRYLHRAAQKALKALETLAEKNPACIMPILRNLLGEHGDYQFDSRTRTKTVDKILSHVDPKLEANTVRELQRHIVTPGQDVDTTSLRLRTYAEYLGRLAILSPAGAEPAGIAVALQELCKLAYSVPDGISQDALTEKNRLFCRARLESVFSNILARTDGIALFCRAMLAIDPSAISMDEAVRVQLDKSRGQTQALMPTTRSPDGPAGPLTSQAGLAVLYAVAIFQLYSQDADAMEILTELEEYFGCDDGGDPGVAGALVEILLSLATRPSKLMRQVTQKVFSAFTTHLNRDSLELLAYPLGCEENAKGVLELFNTEDDEDDEEGGMEIDGEEESGDDTLDANVLNDTNGDGGDGSETDSRGSSEEADREDEAQEEEDENLRKLDDELEKILNTRRADKDGDAEASDEVSDMSDGAMLEIDDQIAGAFKMRMREQANGGARKEKKSTRDAVIHFKQRVVDLVRVYMRQEAANPLALDLIVPLLRLQRKTSSAHLRKAGSDILQSQLKVLRKVRQSGGGMAMASPDTEHMLALLRDIHAEAGLDESHAFTKSASKASLIVVSILFAAEGQQGLDQAISVYTETQKRWTMGMDNMQRAFFDEWFNWCQGIRLNAKRNRLVE